MSASMARLLATVDVGPGASDFSGADRESCDSADALLIGMLRSETAAMACEAFRELCEAPKLESRITDQPRFTRKFG
jgi:hypothetical protein